MDIRQPIHSDHAKTLDSAALRSNFLVDSIFVRGEITLTYSHIDRIIVGGATPLDGELGFTADLAQRFAVGVRVVRLVDRTRRIGAEPRTLVTVVRYPALGAPSAADRPDAPAARAAGPFPLVVFAHGYQLGPDTYARLLRAWARAGYVVAAPAFPRTHASAKHAAENVRDKAGSATVEDADS